MMDGEQCPMYPMDCFIFPDTTILSSPIASYPCQPGRIGNFSNFNGSFAWCYGWIIAQQSSLNVLNQLGLCSGLIGLFAIIFAFTFHVGHRKFGLTVVLIKIARLWIDDSDYNNNNNNNNNNKIINENDFSSSSFSDDDDDAEEKLSHHHKESEQLKNLDWSDIPHVIRNMNREFVNRYDRRQACSYKKQILAVKRTLGNQNLILRPIDKDVKYYRKSGKLQPTTLFASFNIDDSSTKFSHSKAIDALVNFLTHYMLPDHLTLDEAFITWSKSEEQLRILLAMANKQFSQSMWQTNSIESTIHFRDLEFSHYNGVLRTSAYHEPNFQDDKLPSFLDIMQYPIHDIWNWIRAALLKAVRYCSDNESFDEEKLEIKFLLDRHDFPEDIFNKTLQDFLQKFGSIVTYPPFQRSNYEILRQHVFNYDKHRQAKKKKRQKEKHQQKHIVMCLPYAHHLDALVLNDFEQKLNNLIKTHLENQSYTKDFTVKRTRYHPFPFSINDLPIKKRPAFRLLTLSENELNKHSYYEKQHLLWQSL
ncbi:unnamed protein product [Rotaria magnacalcarata]